MFKFVSPILSLLSGSNNSRRLPILTYHRVLEEKDPMLPWDPDQHAFRVQMTLLRDCFNPHTLTQAIHLLRSGKLPPRSVCVTFDDGYLDNHDVALPILSDLDVPATFFIATNYMNGEVMWNDLVVSAVRGLSVGVHDIGDIGTVDIASEAEKPAVVWKILRRIRYESFEKRDRLAKQMVSYVGLTNHRSTNIMMNGAMVKKLEAAGMEVGAHTRTHPILAGLSDEAAESEIVGSKADLETLLGHRIDAFAYPNGRFGKDETGRDSNLVKAAGFKVAVTTDWGAASEDSDDFSLPRLGLSGENRTKLLIQLARAYRSKDPNASDDPPDLSGRYSQSA